MAELPDLTFFARILSRRFKNRTVKSLTITEARKLNANAEALKSALEGQTLNSVSREGKTLQFHFSGDQLGLFIPDR